MRRDYSKDIPERAMDAHWYMCMQVYAHAGTDAPLSRALFSAIGRTGMRGLIDGCA